jgi:hypothetical protein
MIVCACFVAVLKPLLDVLCAPCLKGGCKKGMYAAPGFLQLVVLISRNGCGGFEQQQDEVKRRVN